MNLAVKKFRIFFTMNLTVKIFRIFFTINLAVKICRFFYTHVSIFFLSWKMKSHLTCLRPIFGHYAFFKPKMVFFSRVSDIWEMPFKTFLGLFDELKTFWDNLGPHVPLITLWWQVKIVFCTNFYEEFDRKKNFELFFTLNLNVKFFRIFLHWI